MASSLERTASSVKEEITDMIWGDEWDADKLSSQLQTDVSLSMAIFIISNIAAACVDNYWRPIVYDVVWIFLGVIVWAIGFFTARCKSSFGLAGFVLLLTILGSLNISHTMTMKDSHDHMCNLAQSSFEGCQHGVDHLSTCFKTNSCTKEQLDKTNCKALAYEHCKGHDDLDVMYWIMIVVNFITFGEPAFWGLIMLIRLEFSGGQHLRDEGTPEKKTDIESAESKDETSKEEHDEETPLIDKSNAEKPPPS